jgi:PTS system mannose-specific IIB component
MNIQLLRIDDRLIHGQVVIGWASHLNTREIILCDDSVVENEWEKELYLSCVPGTISAQILTVTDTAAYLMEKSENHRRTIVLVESPFVIEQLLDKGAPISEVNIGGMHYKDARKKFLPYVYINEEEISVFNRCMERNVRFECLDVPNGKKVALEKLL